MGFRCVVAQRGTPAPRNYPDAQIIEIPVETLVTMSTTYLAHRSAEFDRMHGSFVMTRGSDETIGLRRERHDGPVGRAGRPS